MQELCVRTGRRGADWQQQQRDPRLGEQIERKKRARAQRFRPESRREQDMGV